MNSESFEIRKLSTEDLTSFQSLIGLFNRVFEETQPACASDTHLRDLLSTPSFIALAAFVESELVGGLTAYELPMYQKDLSEILVYDLAVRPDYQRRGLGKQLLQHLKEYCSVSGIQVFFVLVHEEDEHAVEFYRATGGQGEKVINFVYEATARGE